MTIRRGDNEVNDATFLSTTISILGKMTTTCIAVQTDKGCVERTHNGYSTKKKKGLENHLSHSSNLTNVMPGKSRGVRNYTNGFISSGGKRSSCFQWRTGHTIGKHALNLSGEGEK